MLALDADQWARYAKGDLAHTGLVYPPDGISMTYDEGLAHVPAAVREKPLTPEVFERQVAECEHGINELAKTIAEVDPDWILVIDRGAAIGQEGEAAQATLDNPLVAGTKAAQNGQILYLDSAPLYLAGGGIRSLMGTLDQIEAGFLR